MPESAEVVVVGGGVIGSSIAVRLRQRMREARIVVVERDPTYARASSHLATGGIRQQYESPLNVAMARYGTEFYRRFDQLTAGCGHRSRAWFRQRGYLFLADEGNADRFARRYETQKASGANVERWTAAQIADRFAGLATHDIEFGLFGPEDGYLDPREVLAGLQAMARAAGVEYLHGSFTGIARQGGRVAGACVETPEGSREITTPVVVNAAGAYAAAVGAAAGLALPIEPVRQQLFRLALEERFPSRLPMLFDPDGTHWRIDDARTAEEDECLIIGRSRAEEPVGENFECDHARLDGEMLPTFMRRQPDMRVRSVMSGWAGLYEMTPDHNALIGEHPDLPGFVVAAGFSGHGLMMAPATGLAVAELITEGRASSFDVAPLAVDRFARGAPFVDGALV
jgi:FAD-dependent oxidoreductase domain-containing protein 1